MLSSSLHLQIDFNPAETWGVNRPDEYSTQRNLLNKNPTQPKSTHNQQEMQMYPVKVSWNKG